MRTIPANIGESRFSSAALSTGGIGIPLQEIGTFYFVPRSSGEVETVDPLAGLYDGSGLALNGQEPPLVLGEVNFLICLTERPAGAVLTTRPFLARDLALIWMLPLDMDPARPPGCIVALIVQALDGGGAVALHAADEAAIDAVKDAVWPITGGGRA